MPDEPDERFEAVTRVEDAFGGHLGPLEYEDGLDPAAHDADVIHLRKACRLLDATSEWMGFDVSFPMVLQNNENGECITATER